MENKTQNATAIDNANAGNLIQFHANGWRLGTLVTVTNENVTITPLGIIGSKPRQNMTKALDDVRLVITEAPKRTAKPKPATATKPKAVKSGKPDEKPEAPARIASPETTIELAPTDASGVYAAKVHGKRAIVCYGERNRSSAAKRNNSVTFAPARIAAAKKLAKAESLPLYFGLQVRVAAKWDSGWVISAALFTQQVQSTSDFSLTSKARAAYAADSASLMGLKFAIAKH